MLGAVVTSPVRFARRDHTGAVPTILHLAPTRSAAVRLAPVAAALDAPQALVDGTGRVSDWAPTDPPTWAAALPAPVLSRAVTAALNELAPDVVLIAGDDDRALVCALAAARAGVPIARIGAGLRCGDRGVKREINRITIDELAARLYTDGEVAEERLRAEGIDEHRILRVGSTLAASVDRWRGAALDRAAWESVGVRRGEYVLISLRHADKTTVEGLAERFPVVVTGDLGPLDYIEFLSLEAGAGAVVTDSAGVQEETTVLGVPCFTRSSASERTITLTHGTNTLLGDDPPTTAAVTTAPFDQTVEPALLWDGDVGKRVALDLLDTPWESA
jgi:UDP-N-acetylglucosamine 2-epimerase (non-hydrolysing)